jgi:hypothetical protein
MSIEYYSPSYPTVILTFSWYTLFSQTRKWRPSHSGITVSSGMEEMPSLFMPVLRLKVSSFGGLGVSALAFGTQVRGFKPGWSRRIFQGEKILSAPSFGREVKPWVSCRWFKACKRSLGVFRGSRRLGKINRPFLAHIAPALATRIARGLWTWETTGGESWNV